MNSSKILVAFGNLNKIIHKLIIAINLLVLIDKYLSLLLTRIDQF